MSYYDILLAKQLSGGGGDITVESLSVTANGTYTAPSGKAYSPVVANVPNSYTASDEGKVVSSGALVAQTSQTIDTNGTYDTTLKNQVVVNVSGGSGLEYETGEWSPSENITSPSFIPFSNTHTELPFLVVIDCVNGGSNVDAKTAISMTYVDFGQIGQAYTNGACGVVHMSAVGNNAGNPSNASRYITTNGSGDASKGYYVANNGFYTRSGDETFYYWRSKYTYKWIAIWAPTS